MIAQPLMAGSSIDGGEKQRKQDTGRQMAQPAIGDQVQPGAATAEMTSPSATTSETGSTATATSKTTGSVIDATRQTNARVTDPEAGESEKVIKSRHDKHKILKDKPLREHRKHAGGNIIGILALVFGILAFLLGWVLWPVGLLFAITAIILGAIGIGRDSGRVMAIIGMILGILAILIPILIVALLLALLL